MLNKIAFIYEVADKQENKFSPNHTIFDCAIQYGTNATPYKFTYQCNTEYVMPNIKDVMEALMLDAQTYEYEYADVREMCDCFGYDYYENTEKYDRIWNACKRTCEALHEMFTQDDLDKLAEELNN